jgi:hypothetical protein
MHTIKNLGISKSTCAECPMLYTKTLSIKPVNHPISSCKNHPDFSFSLPLKLINFPLNKDGGFCAIWPDPTILSFSLLIKLCYCFAICVSVQCFVLRYKNPRTSLPGSSENNPLVTESWSSYCHFLSTWDNRCMPLQPGHDLLLSLNFIFKLQCTFYRI